MFKPTAAKTPEEYIESIEEPRRSEIQTLHDFICKIIPNEKPHIMSGMIGYGHYHYKSAKTGREGDWSIIALSSRKNYISFYSCAADGTQYISEKYKDKLPKAKVGKSCINFKKVADIDLKVLEKIIKESMKVMGQEN